MRPFVYHSVVLRDLFFATVAVSAAAELALQLRTQSGEARDPSYVWMLIGSSSGIALAFIFAGTATLPGPRWLPAVLGLALMWAGFALRFWSVRTLGRFFRVEVSVTRDQKLVDTGPYAWLRHPSYTGLLAVYAGLGIALDSWLSLAAAALLPLAAVVNRIRYEERALLGEMGERYRDYAGRTDRLVPGLW
jgi:protein-S-isoprenylcysteine O-methyltransferase Ste14